MKAKLKPGILTLLLTLFISALFTVNAFAEAPLIYVSGNPNCYPVEYFNEETEVFEGYIPSLLSDFAEAYGYNLKYLDAGQKDNRKEHHKNAQVELISSCTDGENFSKEAYENGVVILSADKEYRLLFTAATSKALKENLTKFITAVPTEKSNTILIETAAMKAPGVSVAVIIIFVGLLALCLAAIIILAILLKRKSAQKISKDTDILTGVGNFTYLEKYFKQFINDKNRALYSAVYFGAYLRDGREDQNAFLKTIAVILNAEIGDTDILARIDDGFFVLKNLSEKSKITAWVEEASGKINRELKERKEFTSAVMTAGIYSLLEHDRDLDKMISNTAYCCRYARKNGKLFSVYSRAIERAEREEDQLKEDIKVAFKNDEFAPYLQFFVNAHNREILGAEALSRWNHPTLGVLNPGKYIDILESERLIQELDFTILKKSCQILEEISKETDRPFFIAFNFSRNTLTRPDFVKRTREIVSEFGFSKERLLLEVTEYAHLSDNKQLFANITEIKKLGIRVVIDDFGSGFTDLIDIGKGDFDGVKLDKSLIDGEHTEAEDIILKSLIDLIHQLGMTVIAEGIESKEQVERLMKAGCSVIQGFYYFLPLPRLEAMRILLSQSKEIN